MNRSDMLKLAGGVGLSLAVGGTVASRAAAVRLGGKATDTVVMAVPNDVATLDKEFSAQNPTTSLVQRSVYAFGLDYQVFKDRSGQEVTNSKNFVGLYFDQFTNDPKNPQIWTARIRKGSMWPTGDPVTAEDLQWSKNRAMFYKTNVWGVYRIIGLTDPSQFELVDDRTLRFHQAYPSLLTPQVQNISSFIYNSKLMQAHATTADPWAHNWATTNQPGGGPYTISSYTPGQELVLTATPSFPNKHYAPTVKTVRMPIISDSSVMKLELQKGDIDIAYGLPRSDVYSLQGTKGLAVRTGYTTEMNALNMDLTHPPFDNVAVRRALAYAVPTALVKKFVWSGHAQEPISYFPFGMAGQSNSYPYNYDLKKAKGMLAAAGYPNGFNVELAILAGSYEQQQIAIVIGASFKQVGVNLQISQLDAATFSTRRFAQNIPLQLINPGVAVNDGGYLLGVQYTKGAAFNYGQYTNPQLETIASQLYSIVDVKQRQSLLTQAQQILAADVPTLLIGQPNNAIVMKESISPTYIFTTDSYPRIADLRLST